MPKENGGEESSEKGSEEAVWRCQGDGGGEEMLQLKGTQREKIMEKHFSLTQSKAGGEEEEEDGMERWETVERGGESNYSRVWGVI